MRKRLFALLCFWVAAAALSPAQRPGDGATSAQRGTKAARGATIPQGKTYALVIGISRYEHDPYPPSLQFADKDAEAFAALLRTPVGGELREPDQIRVLTNDKATRAGIDDALKNFVAPHADPANTLILFVAAHGVYLNSEEDPVTHRPIDKEPYVLTYDSNTNDPKTTGYPMDEFRRMIAEQAGVFGRVLVFIDVCHADNVAGISGGAQLEPAVQRVFEGRVGDLGLMMAAHAKKFAYESEMFGGGHGAFSYFLISGLNGSAALEGNQSITFADAFNYVSSKVYAFTKGAQQPGEINTNPDMVVVPDIHREGLTLAPAQPIAPNRARDLRARTMNARGAPTPEAKSTFGDGFEQSIVRGSLLPEESGSASVFLKQMRADPSQNPADIREREQRLHVALEDKGQEIMSQYLEGDQVPQTKAAFERCARYFEEAVLLTGDPAFDRSRALFCEGRALIFDAQFDRAEALLNASIQIDSKRAYAYNALGIAELERSARTRTGLDAAESAFRAAMRYAPYWPYPVHNLALLESERGNYDQSIKLYQEAMAVAPRYSYLPYNLGFLYQRLGDYDNARRWYERARQLAENARGSGTGPWPERAQVWNAEGTVAVSLGQDRKARKLFQRALTDDPSNANARHNLALEFMRLGDLAKADELWLQNLAMTPKFDPSWISYAESLASRGDLRRSALQYQGIIALHPDYVGAREALARVYLRLKQADDAMVQLDAGFKLSASNAGLLELRGDAELLKAENDRARADWNDALTLATAGSLRSRIKSKIRALN